MQLFVSWSGDASREVAEVLASFIQHVVRGVYTFVSTHDIDVGDRWEGRLSEELERINHAILCVTRDNQDSPWINYEAGALGKLFGRAKVIPYTLGFPSGEMNVGPLSRFQGVENDKAGTWNLVRSLNHTLPSPNEDEFVREAFDQWWPRFEKQMAEALVKDPNATERNAPSEKDLLLDLRPDVQRLLDHFRSQEPENIQTAINVLEGALRDPLTKLPNRHAFAERASELDTAGTPYVIGFIDLDAFRHINDTLGHARGDELLALLAARMKEQLSSADMVARLGGDEFAAIFRNTPPEVAVEALRQLITVLPRLAAEFGFPSITASGGVSSDRIEPSELKLRDADRAMYQAKNEGRARVKLAD
ncbi:MAG: diguanylate cyclase [Thiobacillaceae bacterium]